MVDDHRSSESSRLDGDDDAHLSFNVSLGSMGLSYLPWMSGNSRINLVSRGVSEGR